MPEFRFSLQESEHFLLIGINGVNLLTTNHFGYLDVWPCSAVLNPIGPEIVTLTMRTLLTCVGFILFFETFFVGLAVSTYFVNILDRHTYSLCLKDCDVEHCEYVIVYVLNLSILGF